MTVHRHAPMLFNSRRNSPGDGRDGRPPSSKRKRKREEAERPRSEVGGAGRGRGPSSPSPVTSSAAVTRGSGMTGRADGSAADRHGSITGDRAGSAVPRWAARAMGDVSHSGGRADEGGAPRRPDRHGDESGHRPLRAAWTNARHSGAPAAFPRGPFGRATRSKPALRSRNLHTTFHTTRSQRMGSPGNDWQRVPPRKQHCETRRNAMA